ncbi:MAG TPA: hypothetical protein VLK33_03010, partial [Terriglobales bacterium]|nr:hypothetical protein [Terriglobales bacterium]
LAASQNWQVPVIVHSANQDCRNLPNATTFGEQIYFVVTYAESAHSLCVVEYAPATEPESKTSITLSEASGENHGAKLPFPVRAVPVGHVFKVLPDFVIAMMDYWRKEPNRSQATVAYDSHTQISSSPSLPTEDINLNFNLYEIRADVARKHNRINFGLNIVLGLLSVAVLASTTAVGLIYRRFRIYLLALGAKLSWRSFLFKDLDELSRLANRNYNDRLAEFQALSRREAWKLRERDLLRERLKGALNLEHDEKQQQEIESCLTRNEPEEMLKLCQDLQCRPHFDKPEQRLDSLLESLKEYCEPQEFENFANEAHAVINASGFRPARELVVRLHEQLRFTAKQAAKKQEEQKEVKVRPTMS